MEPRATLRFEEIRQRAYELWERNHQPMGFEIEFWVRAEQELRAERDRQTRTTGVRGGEARPAPANAGEEPGQGRG